MSSEPRKGADSPILASNREASHQYHLHERFEAGLVLLGTEVKAAREHRVQLQDAFVALRREEAWLENAHFGAYSHAGYATHEPTRSRKLLLHKNELRKLSGKLTRQGYTLVPLKLFLKNGRLKLELALAEGKKTRDKREAIKARETEREVRRALRDR